MKTPDDILREMKELLEHPPKEEDKEAFGIWYDKLHELARSYAELIYESPTRQ